MGQTKYLLCIPNYSRRVHKSTFQAPIQQGDYFQTERGDILSQAARHLRVTVPSVH